MPGAYELELLSPAKNALQGIEAIRHGADAVYIGAPAFGARAAVPVSLDDIGEVVRYAHLFRARVYVALNTILYPEEVPEAVRMAWDLYRIGADALIIQDLALLNEEMPPIALHASTQMDNVEPEKAAFWAGMGLEQAVLPREFSPREIARIHREAPEIRLEAFVHGALCVSYSGRCYAAAAFHGRSANRGSCSQVCRLPFDLIDGDNRLIAHGRHLLSLKDLNRSSVLPELIAAGVRSFKIEGRLKDLPYVKTVTAYYSRLLNDFIGAHPDFKRSSRGEVTPGFEPEVSKTFNRGFTTFTHRGRGSDDLPEFRTPKHAGEEIGVVRNVDGTRIRIDLKGAPTLHNGDGFTFFLPKEAGLAGFRANTASGDLITVPRKIKGLAKGVVLYRNYDAAYERKLLTGETATRLLPVAFRLSHSEGLLTLRAAASDASSEVSAPLLPEISRNGETRPSAESVLSKLGGTPFRFASLDFDDSAAPLFVPRSLLTELRQKVVPMLEEALREAALQSRPVRNPRAPEYDTIPFFKSEAVTSDNILNSSAEDFVRKHGATVKQPAYEKEPVPSQPVMTTKHCLRYALGMCPRLQGFDERKLRDPWLLRSAAKEAAPVEMRIEFDCTNCQMRLYKTP